MPDGELFGLDRLTEFIEREAAAEQPAPETLRRLRRTLLDAAAQSTARRRDRRPRLLALGWGAHPPARHRAVTWLARQR